MEFKSDNIQAVVPSPYLEKKKKILRYLSWETVIVLGILVKNVHSILMVMPVCSWRTLSLALKKFRKLMEERRKIVQTNDWMKSHLLRNVCYFGSWGLDPQALTHSKFLRVSEDLWLSLTSYGDVDLKMSVFERFGHAINS